MLARIDNLEAKIEGLHISSEVALEALQSDIEGANKATGSVFDTAMKAAEAAQASADKVEAKADVAIEQVVRLETQIQKERADYKQFRDRTIELLQWRWRREKYSEAVLEIPKLAGKLSEAVDGDISEVNWPEWTREMNRWRSQFERFASAGFDLKVFRQRDLEPSSHDIANEQWAKSEGEFPSARICLSYRQMRLMLVKFNLRENEVSSAVDAAAFG